MSFVTISAKIFFFLVSSDESKVFGFDGHEELAAQDGLARIQGNVQPETEMEKKILVRFEIKRSKKVHKGYF